MIWRYSPSVNARQVSEVMAPLDVIERSALATTPSSGASPMATLSLRDLPEPDLATLAVRVRRSSLDCDSLISRRHKPLDRVIRL